MLQQLADSTMRLAEESGRLAMTAADLLRTSMDELDRLRSECDLFRRALSMETRRQQDLVLSGLSPEEAERVTALEDVNTRVM
jgi:hypothetical protein